MSNRCSMKLWPLKQLYTHAQIPVGRFLAVYDYNKSVYFLGGAVCYHTSL